MGAEARIELALGVCRSLDISPLGLQDYRKSNLGPQRTTTVQFRRPLCLPFHHSGIIIDGTSVSPICTLSLRLYGFVSTWHRLPSTAIINCVLFYIVPLLEIHGSSCSTPMISRLWLSRLCGTSPSLPLCGSHIQPPRHRLLPDRQGFATTSFLTLLYG